MRTLHTIRDAEQLIGEWVQVYRRQPTPEQIHRAARALIDFLGGYGTDADEADEWGILRVSTFDLYAHLD